MKTLVTVALMLNMAGAGMFAQQRTVRMMFSGTGSPGTVNLQRPATTNSEDNSAEDGTPGPFAFRNVRAIRSTPEPSSACSGPTRLYFSSVAGAGVSRFQDGSSLNVKLTDTRDRVDLAAPEARCTMTFLTTGGTGRFKGGSGIITLTGTALPVLSDASGNTVFFASSWEFTGTITGAAFGDSRLEDRQ